LVLQVLVGQLRLRQRCRRLRCRSLAYGPASHATRGCRQPRYVLRIELGSGRSEHLVGPSERDRTVLPHRLF